MAHRELSIFPKQVQISHADIFVADGGGEEFEEAARGVVAGAGDRRRHDDGAGDRGSPGGRFRDELVHGR